MEELPEKNTPQSRPEDSDPKAEDASAEVPAEESAEPRTPSLATEAGPQESSPESTQPQEAQPEPKMEQDGLPAAESGRNTLGEPAAESLPASETPAGDAQGEAAAEDVQLTPSGAVRVPSAEGEPGTGTERSQEERPRKAPARPEKPTGPRLAELRPGQVVEGTVTRIEKYGAFVNLGLVERRDGLIHVSELAPYRIRRVEDVVQVGSPVRARVVSVDLGRGRVALSLNDLDEVNAREASAGPSEPSLTSMAHAFQEAQNRRKDQDKAASENQGRVGDKKKREQEELMRRLRADSK